MKRLYAGLTPEEQAGVPRSWEKKPGDRQEGSSVDATNEPFGRFDQEADDPRHGPPPEVVFGTGH